MAGTPEPRFYYKRDDTGRPVTTVCLIEVTHRTDGIRYAYGATTCGEKDLPHLRKDVGRRIAEQRARKVLDLMPMRSGSVYDHRLDMKLLTPDNLSPLERRLFGLDKPKAEQQAAAPDSIPALQLGLIKPGE